MFYVVFTRISGIKEMASDRIAGAVERLAQIGDDVCRRNPGTRTYSSVYGRFWVVQRSVRLALDCAGSVLEAAAAAGVGLGIGVTVGRIEVTPRPQQCCKEPCWGPPSKGDGLTRYTMRTSCSSISTFFTKARTTSRRVSQSGSCNSWETRFANSSNWPITSRSSTSWLASSIRCRHSSSSLARRCAPPRSSARIPTCRATRRRRHRSIVKSSFLDLQSSC